MDALTLVALLTALTTTAITAAVSFALVATRKELERVTKRMERLDAVVDDVALRELQQAMDPTETKVTGSDRIIVADMEDDTDAEANLFADAPLRDSGSFEPIGLEFATDAGDTDEDFAAPRMTREVQETPRQIPARERHETPAGSPRSLMPPTRESLVAVGKIEIRSDGIDEER